MLFDRFSDEASFRRKLVRPLLTRMGFITVAEKHGQQEYGKDFVFSELTPFGFVRHYAAVVKHERKISQTATTLCSTVLAQVRQAFSVTFQLPDAEAVHRVSSVVVFNSGLISENARVWLRAELDEERYGRNVHVLDGERLFQLDLASTFRQGENLLPKLQGMKNDIQLNLFVWKSIRESLPLFQEGRGQFTLALESFLAAPFLVHRIPCDEVATLLQEGRIIESINRKYMQPHGVLNLEGDLESLKSMLASASQRAKMLLECIDASLADFKLLSSE